MNLKIKVGFLSLVRPTYDVELANQKFSESKIQLMELGLIWGVEWAMQDSMISRIDEIESAMSQWSSMPDIILVQFSTFVDARYIEQIALLCQVPIIVWATRESSPYGERLSLNSLTGANLAANQLTKLHVEFQVVYGDLSETTLQDDIFKLMRVWATKKRVSKWDIITVGSAPDGFFFSSPNNELLGKMRIQIHNIALNNLFEDVNLVDSQKTEQIITETAQYVKNLEQIPLEQVKKYAGLRAVLETKIQEFGANAVAIRCWPEFFTEFGGAACSTVSALTENGIATACEADIFGALSMDILSQLSTLPPYLGDLVEIDESNNAVVFWHCGAGAFSLASKRTGAQAGIHPNRNLGFTLEFGLKEGTVTIFRLGEDGNHQLRGLIGIGEIIDEPQRFKGTSGKVRLRGENNVKERTLKTMNLGFEPHYAIVYGDCRSELQILMNSLDIPIKEF